MFKSKHSGWTWDLKRTPFGGGGGGFISDIGSTLASIDPGPAIGSAGASLDKTVNDNIPGGWITVGALAAGGLALAYAPEVMALAESAGMTPQAAAAALGTAPVDVATGATVPLNALDAYMGSAGLDAGTFGAEAAGGAGTAGGYGLNAGAPSVGAYSPSGAAATQSSLGLGSAPSGLATSSVGMGGTTGAGSLAGIAGSETAAGLGGSALGTGLTADQLAQYEAANPSSSISPNDVNNARKLAQSLMGNSLAGAAQNMAVGQNGVASAIPGIVRGNQTPFVQSQNFAVSNPKPDLSALVNLLKQG